MLKGLEISEIRLSELERTLRLDAEFYSKVNLNFTNLLKETNNRFITDIADVSDGNHMSISDKFIEVGIPYYRGQNIHEFFIENSNPICIDEKTYNIEYLGRSHLQKGDVLLSIVGTIGEVSIVSTNKKATCNCKLAILRTKTINEFYLAIFLKTKFGQNQIKKFTRGAVQKGLILEDMDQLIVPLLSDNFQNAIEKLCIHAFEKIEESKNLYAQAEQLLLQELGLADFTPTQKNINIKSFSESFGATGRLDAEYYQPKYEEVEQKIKAYQHGYTNFHHFIKSFSTGYPYESSSYIEKDGVPIIRINNIGKGYLNISNAQHIPQSDFTLSKKDIANENDVLISMSGTIGNSCKIPKGIKAVVNQRIMRITPKNINVDVFPLTINSVIGQLQLERIGTGGVQTNISAKDIQNILIPLLPLGTQEKIAELVQKSFALRQESTCLLQKAKTAVEIAIEKGEEHGLELIE